MTDPHTNTIAEAELPILSDTETIVKFRAITATGKSVNVTPKQVVTVLGIDMSLLTEQAIPGEFALNRNQVRSQVYVRTFVGTTKIDTTWTELITLPESGRVVDGFGSTLQSSATIPNQPIGLASIIRGASGANTIGFTPHVNFGNAGVSIVPHGATYCITLKYVK